MSRFPLSPGRTLNALPALRTPALFLFLVFLASCVAHPPIGKIDALTRASYEVATGARAAYTTAIELEQKRLLAVLYTNETPGPESYELRPEDSMAPRLLAREAAIDVLVHYTEVLQAFAKYDFGSEIDDATTNLAASISSLSKRTDAGIDSGTVGVLSSIVNAAARWMAESARTDALIDIMSKAQPAIEKICTLLNDDHALLIAENIKNNRRLIRANTASFVLQLPSIADRAAKQDDLVRTLATAAAALETLDIVRTTLAQYPAAHREILNAMVDQPIETQLRSLVEDAQRIHKYYRNIKSLNR